MIKAHVSRKITAGTSIDLDICAVDLTIKGGQDDLLRVSVDFGNSTAKLTAGDYRALDVMPEAVKVKLYLPKRPRAKVVVVSQQEPRTYKSTLSAADCLH